jgi:hypothetical protein
MHRLVLGGMVGLVALGACSGRGAKIAVSNESRAEVRDLRVRGRCFDQAIGVLGPGRSATVRVKPCGESGIRTTFVTDGVAHDIPEIGYIEAGEFYSVKLVIGADLTVHEASF